MNASQAVEEIGSNGLSARRLASVFSPQSKRCSLSEPGKPLATSAALGWATVLVVMVEGRGTIEPYEADATPDQSLVVVTQGALQLRVDVAGSWRTAHRTVGSVGLTPGGCRSRIRWTSVSPVFETAHIYLPSALLEDAADELRSTGRFPRTEPPNALGMNDPVVGNLAIALARGLQDGESDLFAGTVSRAITLRLLSLQNVFDFSNDSRSSGTLSKGRLDTVCAYMRANLGQPLTLDQIAVEAGYSRAHFARAFKRALGVAPHQYLLERRLEKAALLLTTSDDSVMSIAYTAGFASGTHLATAFRAYYRQTPGEFRRISTNLKDKAHVVERLTETVRA